MATKTTVRTKSLVKRKFDRVAILLCLALGLPAAAFSQEVGLEQAIREVCANSDSVKMMKESLVKANEQVREKRANAFPVVSGTVYAGRSRGSLMGGASGGGASSSRSLAKPQAAPGDTSQAAIMQAVGAVLSGMFDGISGPQNTTIYSSNLTVNQPIYTFGKVENAIKVSKLFNQSARYSYERNLQTLQLVALDAFYRAVLATKASEIAERSLSRKKELYEFLDRNFQLGSGSKAQVLATKADYANQSSATVIARRDAVVARMYLNAFMGRVLTDSAALDTVGMLTGLAATPIAAAEEAVKSALDQRADLKAIRLMAESNKGGAKIFKSMYLPSIFATGSVGYSKYDSESPMVSTDPTASWSVGVGASWTFFDGFANSAKAAQFSSDARKLDIVGDNVSKMVEIEIRSAVAECFAADSNLAASREMCGAAQESYDLTNSNFKQGSGQFADLQLADELLQQAELGLINARYRQTRSRAALLVAMGRDIIKINEEL